MLPVFQYARPACVRRLLSQHWHAGLGLEPAADDAGSVMTRILRGHRYRRHLRRAFLQGRRAGYRPSIPEFAEMQRQARAHADGAG